MVYTGLPFRGNVRPPGPWRVNTDSPQAIGLIAWHPLDARQMGPVTVSGVQLIRHDAQFGSALNGDGSTNLATSVPFSFAPYSDLILSFWFFPVVLNTSSGFVFEYTTNWQSGGNNGFVIDANSNAGGGSFYVGFRRASGGYWADYGSQGTAGEWHHYLVRMDSNTPQNQVWRDGAPLTLNAVLHNGSGRLDFADSTLYLLSRNLTSIKVNGAITDLRVYDGTKCDAATLAAHIYAPETRWDLYAPA